MNWELPTSIPRGIIRPKQENHRKRNKHKKSKKKKKQRHHSIGKGK